MLAVIVYLQNDDQNGEIQRHPLYNKETIIGRQVRILEEQGINRMAILNAPEDILKMARAYKRGQTEIIDSISSLDGSDSVLIMQSDVVFTKSIIAKLIAHSDECAGIVDKVMNRQSCWLKARIDMRRISQIDTRFPEGVWFDHLPLYKLRGDVLKGLLNDLLDHQIALWQAVQRILHTTEIGFFECKSIREYAAMPAAENFDIVNKKLMLYDAAAQRKESGAGKIMCLPGLLEEFGMQKMLLMCDKFFDSLPVKDYLNNLGIDYVLCEVAEEPNNRELNGYIRQLHACACDSILSVGASYVVNAAKIVKTYAGEEHFDMRGAPIEYSAVRHIAVPVDTKFGCESTALAQIKDGESQRFLDHPGLLPDAVILDVNMRKYLHISFEKELNSLQNANQDEKQLYETENNPANGEEEENSTSKRIASFREFLRASKGFFRINRTPSSRQNLINFIGHALNLIKDERMLTLCEVLAEKFSIPLEDALFQCLPYAAAHKIEQVLAASGGIEVDVTICGDSDEGQEEEITEGDVDLAVIDPILNDILILLGLKKKADWVHLFKLIGSYLEYQPIATDGLHADVEAMTSTALQRMGESEHALSREDIFVIYSGLLAESDGEMDEICVTAPQRRSSVKSTLKNVLKKILGIYPPFYRKAVVLYRRATQRYASLKLGADYHAILFESFYGDKIGCSPLAIYEYMLNDEKYKDFRYIWAVRNPRKYSKLKKQPNTTVVKRRGKAYYRACATSKYLIANTGFPLIRKFSKDQVVVNTWHGKPLKKIGLDYTGDHDGMRSQRTIRKTYKRMGKQANYFLSTTPVLTKVFRSAFGLKEQDKTAMLEIGYPRNDILFKLDQDDVTAIKMRLGISLSKKVVLYVPTWRPFYVVDGKLQHNLALNIEELRAQLEDEVVILMRSHHLEADMYDFSEYAGFIYDVRFVDDINELYMISDIMISDYSSAIFDYAVLRRPMILYVYDLERYKTEANGLYFDIEEVPAQLIYEEKDLGAAIQNGLTYFSYDEKYRAFNEKFNALEGPDCAQQMVERVIDLDAAQTKRRQSRQNVKKKINDIKRTFQTDAAGLFRGRRLFLSENSKRILAYKDKFKGQRCFLVGNGPSLTIADLEKLKGEICFGCNYIFKIFDRTDWRPDFICFSETVVARTAAKELSKTDIPLFTTHIADRHLDIDSDRYVYVYSKGPNPYYVKGDMLKYYVTSFATVMTYMIEWAFYMGFSEIYLLGVDCTNSHVSGQSGHFIKGYHNEKIIQLESRRAKRFFGSVNRRQEYGQWMIDKAFDAYGVIKQYADKNEYRIYNATRGGALEVFERADLDEIIQ